MNVLMKKLVQNREVKRAGMMLTGCMAIALVASPPARAQFGIDTAALIAALNTVNSTMKSVMQAPMQLMQQTNSAMASFSTNTVFPVAQITAAQSLAGKLISSATQMKGVIDTLSTSAQLPGPQQLETAILSKDPNQVQNIGGLYQQAYGTLPTNQTASSALTNAVDSGDAAAMASMKKAISLDALSERELEVSQQLLSQLQTTAPGNAPVIAAQAAAWVLQGHAYSQAGMAQLLRAQSAELAYTGTTMKLGATANGNSTGAILALPVGK